MARDERFWRNVAIIAIAHAAIIGTLVGWTRDTRQPTLQSVIWMNGSLVEVPARRTDEEVTLPEPRSKPVDQDELSPSASRSDLQLTDTPPPNLVATPIPKPNVAPVANASPRPVPKVPRKKPVVAKVSAKPPAKKKATPAEQEKQNEEEKRDPSKIGSTDANIGNGEKSGSAGLIGGAVGASEFSWYGKMLHDRFYREWIQPTTSVAMGAKISALARIRIEENGRISNFTIVKPSGNVVVDESIAAVGKRVTQVDPLPRGLGSGGKYEVNINFELSPGQ